MSLYFQISNVYCTKSLKPKGKFKLTEEQFMKLAHGPEEKEYGMWDDTIEGSQGFPLDFSWDFDTNEMTVNPPMGFCNKSLTVNILSSEESVVGQKEKKTYKYTYPPNGWIDKSRDGVIPEPFPPGVFCVSCGISGDVSNPQMWDINGNPMVPEDEVEELFHKCNCKFPVNDSLLISRFGQENFYKTKNEYDIYEQIGKRGRKSTRIEVSEKKMNEFLLKYKYTDKEIDGRKIKPCLIKFKVI